MKDNFFKKHLDTLTILGAIVTSVIWMNGKFNEVNDKFLEVYKNLHAIDNRMTKIETVLIVKNIYPSELVAAPVDTP